MKELAQIFLAFIVKTHGISEEQAAELLYQKSEDGKTLDKDKVNTELLTQLESMDAERVQKLKDGADTTKAFEDGYKKAQKETLSKHEDSLRKEYGVTDTNLKGSELVKHIVQSASEGEKGKGKLTEDEIKKSPLYLQLEKERTEAVESVKTEYETKIQDLEKGWQRNQTLSTVKGKVINLLDGLNPVLPKVQTAATNQKNQFAGIFEKYDYQQDGDSLLVLDKESGKRLEDKHGNPIKFENLVKETAAEYFEFAKQDPKGGPGNENGGAGGAGISVPKDEAEYNKAIFEAKTPEDRAAIQTAYEASNASE